MVIPASFHPSSYLTHSASRLLTDASFRANNPSLARALRVAELADLAHLDPALGELAGDDATRAEAERARVEHALFHGGLVSQLRITIEDGTFPPGPTNVTARARLQAHRDFGATHAFIKFTTADKTPLWLLLGRPPWTSPPASEPPAYFARPPLGRVSRPRTPRWIR
jgi:hypothetical protein